MNLGDLLQEESAGQVQVAEEKPAEAGQAE